METTSHQRAFVLRCELPPGGAGPLEGLTFAVKDLIDVAGHVTGCGNPSWRDGHPAAPASAVVVEQLLAAGARLVGKTVTDELAFSLGGENHFYGTPLNPRAPHRVPGGSSSGSASAVAQGLCDFALGTDTGGSVRVPASNCGLFGLRPTHGVISVAGVNPFAPTFDSVGLLAATGPVLRQVGQVLLPGVARPVERIVLVTEVMELVDPAVATAVERALPWKVERVRLADLLDEPVDLVEWGRTYSTVQWGEIWSTLGSWITSCSPEFGPSTRTNFELARGLDRSTLLSAIARREQRAEGLGRALSPGTLLCLPTVPAPAPLLGTLGHDRSQDTYYQRALGMGAVAGFGRLPQVSLPLAEVEGAPVGVSLVGGRGQDLSLLEVAASGG